jgi:hypothetical protein
MCLVLTIVNLKIQASPRKLAIIYYFIYASPYPVGGKGIENKISCDELRFMIFNRGKISTSANDTSYCRRVLWMKK